MGADSGTLTVVQDGLNRGKEEPYLTILSWQTGAGVATFEKDAPIRFRGRIVQLAHKPGATAPTANSDLAIFLTEDDAEADAIITAAGDGLDLVSTAFKKKVMAAPQPFVNGKLRFQITGNAVNDARGTLYVWMAPT